MSMTDAMAPRPKMLIPNRRPSMSANGAELAPARPA